MLASLRRTCEPALSVVGVCPHRLRNNNQSTSESDPRSYEVTWAVTSKAQKKFWGSKGIRTHDLRDTGAMLYRVSYEASASSYNGYKLNSHLTCFQWGFIAQLVEHRTGNAFGSEPGRWLVGSLNKTAEDGDSNIGKTVRPITEDKKRSGILK